MVCFCGAISFDNRAIEKISLQRALNRDSKIGSGWKTIALAKRNFGFAVAYHPSTEVSFRYLEKDPYYAVLTGQMTSVTSHESVVTEILDELFLTGNPTHSTFDNPNLDGDFTLLIWNAEKNECIWYRDPRGISPAYYHFDGKQFSWSSSTDVLLHLGDLSKALDDKWIMAFLCSRDWNWNRTVYRSIRKIPAGHYLVCKASGLTEYPYIQVPKPGELNLRYDEYPRYYRSILENAILSRIRSKSNIGISFSGGTDSSSLAGVMTSLRNRGKINASIRLLLFTFPWEDKWPEQAEEARTIASMLRLPIDVIDTSDVPAYGRWEESASAFDEPDRAMPWYPALSEMARRAHDLGIESLVTGHGGDDFLDGELWYVAKYLSPFRPFRLMDELLKWRYHSKVSFGRMISRWLIKPLITNHVSMARDVGRLPPWIVRTEYESQWFQRPRDIVRVTSANLNPQEEEWYIRAFEKDSGLAWSRTPAYIGRGIDCQFPYFDRELVKFLLQAPIFVKMAPGTRKPLQRNAMVDLIPAPPPYIPGQATGIYMLKGLQQNWLLIRHQLEIARPILEAYTNFSQLLEWARLTRHGVITYEFELSNAIALVQWLVYHYQV